MKKKKCVILLLAIVLLSSIFCINPIYAISNSNLKNEAEISKNVGYSEAYKKWIETANSNKAQMGLVPRKYNIPIDSIYDDTITVKESPSLFNLFGLFSKEKITSAYAAEIPTKFDLRDEINIKVEDQGSDGLCWAFSSLTSLETNLALNGYGDYDFSERHLDYMTSDGQSWGSAGNFEIFDNYIAKNDGPVLEETVPYNGFYYNSDYEKLNSLKSQAYVTETIDFPTIDKSIREYSELELELFRNKVKKHIMDNGSVFCAILSEDIVELETENGEYEYTLYNTTGNVDHAVSIIGWDDSYSKENFVDRNGNIPKNDGAYIALNSWGDTMTIVYISYEDYTVEMHMSGVISATTKVNEIGNDLTVTFKDANLYNYMKNTYPKAITSLNDTTKTINFLGYFNTLELILEIEKQGISDISGLEKLKLKRLQAYKNNISDISALANSDKLYFLDLRYNKITDISAIDKLNNLRYLFLEDNSIPDISSLANLKKLQYLELGNQEDSNYDKILSNISALANLIDLQELNLEGNNISDISALSNLINLKCLDISEQGDYNNRVLSNISALANLVNLQELDLRENNISDISALEDLTNLTEVNLYYNNISDISALANLTNLTKVDLSLNNVKDITALKKISKLDKVTLSYNKVEKKVNYSKNGVTNVELPNIIKEAQNAESLVYSKDGITLENCTWGTDKTSVNIDTKIYSGASVTIKSGRAEGTKLNILVINNVSNIEIKQLPNITYMKGEELDLTSGQLTITYDDGTTKNIWMDNNEIIVTGYDKDTVGAQTITLTYKEKTITFQVTVNEEKLEIDFYEYNIEQDGGNNYIENILPNTRLIDLMNDITTNGSVELYKDTTKIENENIKLSTGMELRLTLNGTTETFDIVVQGDISGDGEVDQVDLLMLARYSAGFERELGIVKGAYLRATDIVKNNVFAESVDLLRLARILVELDEF